MTPSQSICLTRYQKIHLGSSFGRKYLLNFICHTMKFHNCHHTTTHIAKPLPMSFTCDVMQTWESSMTFSKCWTTWSINPLIYFWLVQVNKTHGLKTGCKSIIWGFFEICSSSFFLGLDAKSKLASFYVKVIWTLRGLENGKKANFKVAAKILYASVRPKTNFN